MASVVDGILTTACNLTIRGAGQNGIVQIADAVLDSKVQEGLRRQEKAKPPGISKEDSKKMKEKVEKKTNTEICLTQEKERT